MPWCRLKAGQDGRCRWSRGLSSERCTVFVCLARLDGAATPAAAVRQGVPLTWGTCGAALTRHVSRLEPQADGEGATAGVLHGTQPHLPGNVRAGGAWASSPGQGGRCTAAGRAQITGGSLPALPILKQASGSFSHTLAAFALHACLAPVRKSLLTMSLSLSLHCSTEPNSGSGTMPTEAEEDTAE